MCQVIATLILYIAGQGGQFLRPEIHEQLKIIIGGLETPEGLRKVAKASTVKSVSEGANGSMH